MCVCVIIGYNDKTNDEIETWHAVCHIMCHINVVLIPRLCSVCQTAACLVFCCIMKVSKTQESVINSKAFSRADYF